MSAWSEAEINLLREGAAAGLSTSVIAKQIGRGITRNAVIGKARRLRIALRAKNVRKVRVKPAPISGSIAVSGTDRRRMRKGRPGKVLSTARNGANVEQDNVDRGATRAGHAGPTLYALAGQVEPRTKANLIDGNASLAAREGEQVAAPIPRMVRLLDLKANECRWPVGDPKAEGFGFCGHTKASRAYCAHHAALSYVPLPIRRKAA